MANATEPLDARMAKAGSASFRRDWQPWGSAPMTISRPKSNKFGMCSLQRGSQH